ncbi:MAG: hypothetical protein F6K21_15595, partial [Symploca sp. SIO2D2]|nr:hypothetical protein [Symploca sp. SIO2D2]
RQGRQGRQGRHVPIPDPFGDHGEQTINANVRAQREEVRQNNQQPTTNNK